MTLVRRWDPFREMAELRATMDRLLNETRNLPLVSREETIWMLPLDVSETADAYIVKASIPGVNPDDIDVTLTDNVLTIKAEIKEEKEIEEAKYHLRERRFGLFSRSITLPTAVDADKVEAVYENGVLTLTIPKAEEVKPHKIEVHTHKMIEGESSQVS
ncbi:MAG TPA: Hsp20/alpha crystallin family protein [Anaerolineae bacterium]|nr:Hsp20/alpha crystallin family protein [Anaerolineae bacterium]